MEGGNEGNVLAVWTREDGLKQDDHGVRMCVERARCQPAESDLQAILLPRNALSFFQLFDQDLKVPSQDSSILVSYRVYCLILPEPCK